MKTFTLVKTGEIPSFVLASFEPFENKPATRHSIKVLDETVRKIVVDMEEAHGNTFEDGATLWPKDGTSKWNLEVLIK